MIVDVLAVGLHPRVRTGPSGTHRTSAGTRPMIPGIDGVDARPGPPSLVDETDAGTLEIAPSPMPLSQVERAWARTDAPGERTVLVP